MRFANFMEFKAENSIEGIPTSGCNMNKVKLDLSELRTNWLEIGVR